MLISTIVAFPGPPALEHFPSLLYPFEFPRPFEVFEGCPFSTEASNETPSNTFWLRPKVFDAFDGWGCFGETQAQGDWMASWGDLCPLGPTQTFVNGEWNAVGVSHCKCDFSSAHYFVCVCRPPRVRKCQVEHPPGHISITFHVSVILVTRFRRDFHFQWDELLKA